MSQEIGKGLWNGAAKFVLHSLGGPLPNPLFASVADQAAAAVSAECISSPCKVGDVVGSVAIPAVVGGLAGSGAAAAEGLVASDAINGPRLAMQLARAEAESAFTSTGELSEAALEGARMIIAPGELGNPAIPQGFGKFTTQTFNSPSGPFQVRFYRNPSGGPPFYGLDFKALFDGNKGPTYFRPFGGNAP